MARASVMKVAGTSPRECLATSVDWTISLLRVVFYVE